MLRPTSSPQTTLERFSGASASRELATVAKGVAAASAAVAASLLAACVSQEPCPESQTFVLRGNGMAFGNKGDTGDSVDSAADSADTSETGETVDTGETGDSSDSAQDTAEVPDVIGTWPTGNPGLTISGEMMSEHSGFEPSGVTENGSSLLVVGDDGELAQLSKDGALENYWTLEGDDEGVALNSATGMAAIADEALNGIREFDLRAGTLTGTYCTLDLPEAEPSGFEALAFVAAADAPAAWGSDSQGFYVAGSQYVSDLYVYAASACTGAVGLSSVATIPSTANDVSGIEYSVDTKRLYVLHDNANNFDMIKLDETGGTVVNTYALPTTGQEEGIDVKADCDSGLGLLTIAYDGSTTSPMSYDNSVVVYDDFPVTCH